MNHRPLAVITTRLPPAICGVGSHSWVLRKHWPALSAPVEFLVIDGAAEAGPLRKGDKITEFGGRGADLARELHRLGVADVVLHYAGRAYQRFGCPVWLPGVLAKWKRKFRGGRLLVFFHEMPGDFALTSRHFWLGKVNGLIIGRLALTADVSVTNTEEHLRKLRYLSGRDDVHLVPVGSNIENVGDSPNSRVRTEFVLFGLPFGRLQTLRLFDRHIRRWHADGRLTRLHLIGPEDDNSTIEADEMFKAWKARDVIVRHGALPTVEISRLLHRAQFALTNVTLQTWSKSGAFMACAANGCAPVIDAANRTSVPLSHAVRVDEVEAISEAQLENRRTLLRAWYDKNADWPVVAARLAAWLDGTDPAR